MSTRIRRRRAPSTASHRSTRRPARRGARPVPHPFLELVAEVRPEVDRRLDRRLRALSRQVRPHGIGATVEALRELCARGGKRFRAGLTVAAFAGVKPRACLDPAIDAGVALELLHAYLLVQDDWMDRDDTRRGGPSVHAALARHHGSELLGERSAILASDFGWGLAVQALAEAPAPAARVLRALAAFGEAHRDVLVGQQLDVLGGSEDVETMHSLKTASYTVRGPLLVGACLAGAPDGTLRALRRFAEPLGVAYQVRDDLLGVFGDPAQTGKPAGSDLRAGKRTAVTVVAERALDRAGLRAYRAVFGKPRASPRALARVAAQLERCGAREAVEQRLAQLCAQARRRAPRLALDERARRWLLDAVALVGEPLGARDAPGLSQGERETGAT